MEDLNDKRIDLSGLWNFELDPDKRELREDSLTGRKTIQLIFPELHP